MHSLVNRLIIDTNASKDANIRKSIASDALIKKLEEVAMFPISLEYSDGTWRIYERGGLEFITLKSALSIVELYKKIDHQTFCAYCESHF